jgi:hypothetical protein
MVGEGAREQYDAYARRIGRWDGATVKERMATGRNGHIIDFLFEWPGAPHATPDERRYEDVRGSGIIWRKPEHVKEWQLRLPPLPVEGNPEMEELESTLDRSLLDGYYGREEIMTMLADGNQAWTPHVQPEGWTPHVRDSDEVLDLVHTIWENYRDLADPDGVVK